MAREYTLSGQAKGVTTKRIYRSAAWFGKHGGQFMDRSTY